MNVLTHLRRLRRPLLALALVAAAAFVFASTASAHVLAQGGADIGSNRIVIALFSLLAVGAVGSTVTAFLRSASAASGLDPKTLLYIVCGLLAFGIQATVGLPSFTGDPSLFWADAILFVQTAKTGAEVLYNLGLKALLPDPA